MLKFKFQLCDHIPPRIFKLWRWCKVIYGGKKWYWLKGRCKLVFGGELLFWMMWWRKNSKLWPQVFKCHRNYTINTLPIPNGLWRWKIVLDGASWFMEVKDNLRWCDWCKVVFGGEREFVVEEWLLIHKCHRKHTENTETCENFNKWFSFVACATCALFIKVNEVQSGLSRWNMI